MPSDLSLGVLGYITADNASQTTETRLSADCAGTDDPLFSTLDSVKMSEFITDGVDSIDITTNRYFNNINAVQSGGGLSLAELNADGASPPYSAIIGNSTTGNSQANFNFNFGGLTNTPGEPGSRFYRIGTNPRNFTYSKVSGVTTDGQTYTWAHEFQPSSNLDWTVNIDAAGHQVSANDSALFCEVKCKFYDYGYNSGTLDYDTWLYQEFYRTAFG